MKVIIAGGRDFSDYDLLRDKCDLLLSNLSGVEIVSGGAPGADHLGERFAKEKGYLVKLFNAVWSLHGRSAGPVRNAQMADFADCLIAFWDCKSKGTLSMITLARSKGLKVRVIKY